ncbi:MAG: type II toxin-antitoxin system MqsA family antitoxin [Acidobacteria bacterium]|nr:type II toxin-antitoxin system MqsA family antitoxin [Acidobacteriota bacterium]
MKCGRCRGETRLKRGVYQYTESGLDNVYLQNVELRVCEACGAVTPRINRIKELHAHIGRAIALKTGSLSGAEARYLRKHLGLKGREWAELLHVNVATLSRWEGEEQDIGSQSDLLIRALYFLMLAERQGVQLPERIMERIRAIAQRKEEELAVIIDPSSTPSYSYRPQSQMMAATY